MSIFGVVLFRIFPNLDWIRRETLYLSIFSLNTGKCGPEYLRIRTLFTQCMRANVGPFFPIFPFPSQGFAPTWWNDGKVFSKVFQFKSFNSNRYKIVKTKKKKRNEINTAVITKKITTTLFIPKRKLIIVSENIYILPFNYSHTLFSILKYKTLKSFFFRKISLNPVPIRFVMCAEHSSFSVN